MAWFKHQDGIIDSVRKRKCNLKNKANFKFEHQMKSRNAEYKLRHHKPQIFNRPTKNRLIDVRYELLYRKVKKKISHGSTWFGSWWKCKGKIRFHSDLEKKFSLYHLQLSNKHKITPKLKLGKKLNKRNWIAVSVTTFYFSRNQSVNACLP